MLIVGLTGGIGSGKTEVANFFSDLGTPIIDTDIIAHQLTESDSPVLLKIIQEFGSDFLLDNKKLNRKFLAKTIFNDLDKKTLLESILHPEIKKAVKAKISKLSNTTYIILVVPLLFETSFQRLVDITLVVDSSEGEQIKRTQKRDGKSVSDIKKIIQQQITRQERLACADTIINNSGTLSELKTTVKALHKQYSSADKR